MHEFGVVSHLLRGVEAKARELGAQRVVAINLLIGDRASIVDESFHFYFEALSPGTLAEGAEINMRRVPTRFYCASCDERYALSGADFRCPTCGTVGSMTEEGGQFLVESLEIE